mmetsp:Transcript_24170/g.43237  ORF Transcript_24170/g.43237 Transcript_24170/m.43237 type:complete len:226 (+) Transcript_24170:143-820(+)|eukprot:CAMPEP_0115079852 /NCGR_PEP_ID=MMETSP0227-20121206/18341_1 /TAXON_ID=89957 /ORGANISM="Polarella glacialis, Strain CCMP 1383" /LENGTH=225 /DNA_ID=CAMNT_0002467407 /DNA_START=142 /DNA_END=819 /DNA_ORIENTATION=-
MRAAGRALRAAAAAAGLFAALTVLPSQTGGAFADLGAFRQRSAVRSLSGSISSKPVATPAGPAAPVDAATSRVSARSGVGRRLLQFGAVAAAAVLAALPRRRGRDGQPRRGLLSLRGSEVATGLAAALPAGFKAFASSNAGLMLRLSSLNFCKIYMAMLVLRITIMWFPNINPYRQPFYSMIQLTDPYLNLFRGWMPPIFGIDLSVILAFVVIQAVIDTLTVSPF